MADLPGPSRLPILGNLLQLDLPRLHQVITKWSLKYGDLFTIKLLSAEILVITAPEAVQFVLKNRPEKFRRMAKMDEIIRELGVHGVFNAEGDDWRKQRKLVSNGLNIAHVKNFYPQLNAITGKMLNRWLEKARKGEAVAIKAELMRYTVDITSRLAFGYNMNTIDMGKDAIQDHLAVLFPAIFNRINAPIPYWRYFTTAADKKLYNSITVINETMRDVIETTRQEMTHNKSLAVRPENFLQSLLAGSDRDEPATNEVIIGNVLTMLLAGEDTTAHTITWILSFMHQFPGVQHKMQAEVDQLMGGMPTLAEFDHTARMPYIEAVALEAMRLKPVAPVLFHNALEDVEIEGVMVPKGTGIFLQTMAAATDDRQFTAAQEFLPDRWLEGRCPVYPEHNERAFMPFGAGARFCPGYHLAMTEIKALLAMICKNFTVIMDPVKVVSETLAFTMMPEEFTVRFLPRQAR